MAEISRRATRNLPETAPVPEALVEIYVQEGYVDTILTNFPALVKIFDYDNHREEMPDRDRWGNPCEACALQIRPAFELLPQMLPNASGPIAAGIEAGIEAVAALRSAVGLFERHGLPAEFHNPDFLNRVESQIRAARDAFSQLPVPPGSPAPRWLYLRDRTTILAALRHWQETTDDIDAATECGDDSIDAFPHSHSEIDDLCNRIAGAA
jgi:hypothetical protein